MFPRRLGRAGYAFSALALFAAAVLLHLSGLAPVRLASIVCGLALLGVTTSRFRDVDKSGWWALLLLAPVVCVGVILALMFWRGSPGENRFGPEPYL